MWNVYKSMLFCRFAYAFVDASCKNRVLEMNWTELDGSYLRIGESIGIIQLL